MEITLDTNKMGARSKEKKIAEKDRKKSKAGNIEGSREQGARG